MSRRPTGARSLSKRSSTSCSGAGRCCTWFIYIGRLVRNLAIYRADHRGRLLGSRAGGDRVVDYLRQQPNVSFIWGNHDAAWIGAGLGHGAGSARLRVSLRYRRLAQIDEGYGIPFTPLEYLATTVYADDPGYAASCPKKKGCGRWAGGADAEGGGDHAVQARRADDRANPHWQMDHRRLLHRIEIARRGRSRSMGGVRPERRPSAHDRSDGSV